MRTPTWAQIEQFCHIDGWREVRETGHVYFEKVLTDATVLRTHRSFGSKKAMSPGRFKAVLHHQLRVTGEQFWRALESGAPVDRSNDAATIR